MASPKNPNVFFVGLQETNELRKSVIESTKDVIIFLQKYENFLRIRKEKNEAIVHLKKVIKEITNHVSSLKNKLPESQIHRKLGSDEIEVEKEIMDIALEIKNKDVKLSNKNARRKRLTPDKNKKKEKKDKPPTEMDKLESQLKELESKLKSIE